MVQTENIIRQEIASVESPVFTGLNNHCIRSHPDLDRGSRHSLSPLDYIEAIQDRGFQQAILFSVSAGNDSKVSTMRPDLSTGNKKVKSDTGTFFS
jgi:hypothetical protein